MFKDEDLDPIQVTSLWKKERDLTDSGIQTRELETFDVAVQSIKRKHRQVQTDEDIEEDIRLEDDDSPELSDFMQRIGPLMIHELQKNMRSHAFDVVLTLTCYLRYGRYDHEDWCTHKSALCTWNLDRRTLDANKPDTVMDLSSCLMCIAYHPQKPGLIVGGTFNGEVLVWDLSREDDILVASSGIGDDSHREPISKVEWVKDQDAKGAKYKIVSVSSDGKILVWQRNAKKHKLKLSDGFILLTESLPRHLRVKAKRGDQEMGVTCISFNPLDETTFLIGSESGGIFKCSTNTHGTPAGRELVSSILLSSPVTFSFSPHHGPVYSVDSSPYHRNLFISCGTDNTARIYSLLQMQPVLTLEPSAGYLYSAKWSPVRPLVVAVVTESGQLLLYDLKRSRTSPVHKLNSSERNRPLYSVQFNHKQPLLATAGADGLIKIWHLSDDLTSPEANENDVLEEIAGAALK
ncbi:hypothetical protein LSH36_74g11005 [Paralvinella palmiformis]|uniref:WD repeat-containing protein 34-like n=1 Tax=Paralvinella palmiformis TaxID=53620 RepID=A0AAD9K2Y6_9ANNE|nr:hypothetical protein LSH36_74g11005 [Paralvinella palmiformis]